MDMDISSQSVNPRATLDGPSEVVGDPALSKAQKKEALDVLEQDARQLSVASDEGMTGGEPNGLDEVLDAQSALELPATAYAYDVVRKDLHARLRLVTGEAQAAIERALTALDSVTLLGEGAGEHPLAPDVGDLPSRP
jgi:hypothetical protein